jgi:hypothetical protein
MNAKQRHRALCFLLPLVLTTLPLAPTSLQAQAAKSASASPGSSVPGEGSPGFSIETEMLTYRALESNGEAIACDVASYLEGVKTSFQMQPTGAVCAVPSSNGPSTVGVVILPFDRTVFADFLIWRSDMQTMAEFEQRAGDVCATVSARPCRLRRACSACLPPARPQRRSAAPSRIRRL